MLSTVLVKTASHSQTQVHHCYTRREEVEGFLLSHTRQTDGEEDKVKQPFSTGLSLIRRHRARKTQEPCTREGPSPAVPRQPWHLTKAGTQRAPRSAMTAEPGVKSRTQTIRAKQSQTRPVLMPGHTHPRGSPLF